MHFGDNRGTVISFSVHCIRRQNLSHYWGCWLWSLALGGVCQLSVYEATIFLFVINKYLVGRILWDYINFLFLITHSFWHPLMIPARSSYYCSVCQMLIVCFHHFFSIYQLEFYYKEELPFSPMFVCLFVSVWTDGFFFYYHPFNVHAFYKLRSSRNFLQSSPL